jgi:hypothetical protein
MRSLSSLVALIVAGNSVCTGADLPRSSPEAQGVSSAAVLSFVEFAMKGRKHEESRAIRLLVLARSRFGPVRLPVKG